MNITKQALEQGFAEHKAQYAGLKEDYFALLYLAQEFEKPIDRIAHQVAFGGNDYGFDAFHVDPSRRNLYLYQFKWSSNHQLFKDSLKRLISNGMERIFGNPLQDNDQNQLLLQLKAALHENQSIIDRVLIQFVFNGDPAAAEQSAVLEALREDLESKKYLIDQFFLGREVTLTIQYISNETRKLHQGHVKKTHRYELAFPSPLLTKSDGGEMLHVGFVPLMDLHAMHKEMGHRLFERNIRAGLGEDRPVNRALRGALRDVLDGKTTPQEFVFNHNGVTIFAEKIEVVDDHAILTEPRVLNGAQTITSVFKFMETQEGNQALKDHGGRLKAIRVLAKIISHCEQPFITAVTINTNRQNPVEPANLRASDQVQLELQDKFREELGIFYERQENAFDAMTDEDLQDLGIDQYKAIQIKPLARTFLAAQGEIDRMSRLGEVFESESLYRGCFADRYVKADARRILLVYKIHMRLNRIALEVVEKGGRAYEYVLRAKNLLWALVMQGVLNHAKLDVWLETYGKTLTMEADFSDEVKGIASSKVRFLFKEAVADKKYEEMIKNEKYSFLRTKAMYQRCMDIAFEKYEWKKLPL